MAVGANGYHKAIISIELSNYLDGLHSDIGETERAIRFRYDHRVLFRRVEVVDFRPRLADGDGRFIVGYILAQIAVSLSGARTLSLTTRQLTFSTFFPPFLLIPLKIVIISIILQ
jgi:hypothetical protein